MATSTKSIEPEIVDEDEPRQLDTLDTGVTGELTRAEVDAQVTTAKRYPRSITKFRKTLQQYVTASPDIAEKMNYCLPRGRNEDGSKKFVEGESVRLAEAAVAAWGNTRSGGRTLSADATHVICQGFCHDLENNNYVAFEIRRRITGQNGRRFSDDMITVTGAAGAKIAWRNAVFGVIPKVFIKEASKLAKACAAGALKSVDDARKAALAWWGSLGGTADQLLALLGRPGMDDVTVDDLLRLKGIRTAIEDGDMTLDELVREVQPERQAGGGTVVDAKKSKLESLTDALKNERAATTPPTAASSPAPSSPASEPGAQEAASLFTDGPNAGLPLPKERVPGEDDDPEYRHPASEPPVERPQRKK